MIKKLFCVFTVLTLFSFLTARADETASLPQLKLNYKSDELNYFTYIDGRMELTDVNGEVTTLNAQFKTRGATALQYSMKPSLNMKFRDTENKSLDVSLLGLREVSSVILDAMAIDRINMRNRVCFDIWNDFSRLPYATEFDGINGTEGRFLEVYINNVYKGIYCLSDKINRKLLGLKKPEVNETTGVVTYRCLLYKNGTNDIENQDIPGYYNDFSIFIPREKDAWELHEPEDYPSEQVWAPLAELYVDNNTASYQYVKEHFYLENLADYSILVMALGLSDNWGNKNRYFSIRDISSPGDNSKFVITPWDLDTSLGGEYNGSKYDGDYMDWPVSLIENSAPMPIATCLSQSEFRELLKKRWTVGRNGAFAVDVVKKRLLDICDLFENSGAWQRTVDYWSKQNYKECYVDDLRREVNLICQWYENRFKEMDEYFGVSDEDDSSFENIINEGRETVRVIYNLQGIRIVTATAPGLYIINGRKTILR